jgi:MerR family transcriptional regulator, light-induced transcriptional regulator
MQKTILSTAEVARLFNVTETTVKRWADEGMLRCQKTPGGHRKFEIRNVIEFTEKNHFEPVATLTMPDSDEHAPAVQMAILGRDFPTLVGAFVQKALSPDPLDLFRFLSFLYEHRIHLWEIYDLILRPAMVLIGERWARGEVDISHEHRASYETMDALAKLQAQILIKPAVGKSVVCACLGEEAHEIGLRCASSLFESEGWKSHYLGARSPYSSVIVAIRELRPDAVCLSITHVADERVLAEQLGQISGLVHSGHGILIAGGRGATPKVLGDGIVDAVFSSSKDQLDFIAQMHRSAKGTAR